MLPHITKRRATTILKTKTNQNCQKIKLYVSTTTKELDKKHSSQLVGGAEVGSQGAEDAHQSDRLGRRGGSWWTRRSHSCVQINQEEQLGSETDCATQGSSMGQ